MEKKIIYKNLSFPNEFDVLVFLFQMKKNLWTFQHFRRKTNKLQDIAVADLGFPRGGGANSAGGCQHTILPNFPKNCMKLKEFGPRGGDPKFYYVDPPLHCPTFSTHLWNDVRCKSKWTKWNICKERGNPYLTRF